LSRTEPPLDDSLRGRGVGCGRGRGVVLAVVRVGGGVGFAVGGGGGGGDDVSATVDGESGGAEADGAGVALASVGSGGTNGATFATVEAGGSELAGGALADAMLAVAEDGVDELAAFSGARCASHTTRARSATAITPPPTTRTPRRFGRPAGRSGNASLGTDATPDGVPALSSFGDESTSGAAFT